MATCSSLCLAVYYYYCQVMFCLTPLSLDFFPFSRGGDGAGGRRFTCILWPLDNVSASWTLCVMVVIGVGFARGMPSTASAFLLTTWQEPAVGAKHGRLESHLLAGGFAVLHPTAHRSCVYTTALVICVYERCHVLDSDWPDLTCRGGWPICCALVGCLSRARFVSFLALTGHQMHP